ncbi:MAG: thiosulfate oxidation carrier complex protein SoxZ [Epsilonproteobacteria bacterium]|nr:MAG: thiosulfate oxidation carrier complex protein SoxZ [Campylobacteraceae bacterium 4484_166]RLA74892.1 MAG: thiosulfate oxidation carrier complex protein SoxZ [Campylobacterota bacterium]
MKIKAKIKGDIIKVKAMAKHIMLPYKAAKAKGVEANFITNWKATIANKPVFEVSSSQFLSKNPILKYKLDNKIVGAKAGDDITMVWVDKLGKTKTETKKIK